MSRMILEGLVTTLDAQGTVNIAPMGPVVDEALQSFEFRPYQTSRTFQNLRQHPFGVIHVVDDVLLLVRAALDRWEELPATVPAEKIRGAVLTDCCRWWEFAVVEIDDREPRTSLKTRIVHADRRRDFWGFNRAKHAVLEGAILATRIGLIPPEQLQADFTRLRIPVEKTAGPRELAAFTLLETYLRDAGIPLP